MPGGSGRPVSGSIWADDSSDSSCCVRNCTRKQKSTCKHRALLAPNAISGTWFAPKCCADQHLRRSGQPDVGPQASPSRSPSCALTGAGILWRESVQMTSMTVLLDLWEKKCVAVAFASQNDAGTFDFDAGRPESPHPHSFRKFLPPHVEPLMQRAQYNALLRLT